MRRASEASRQLTEESNRKTPQEIDFEKRERERTLEIQNQPRTLDAQEWMRARGVQGRLGSKDWREGRKALVEEYRSKPKVLDKQWARDIISDSEAGQIFTHYQLKTANDALRLPLEAA
jgi:hypothetical protein